jgi:hypothetical protein
MPLSVYLAADREKGIASRSLNRDGIEEFLSEHLL